jgi:hypothetical protein
MADLGVGSIPCHGPCRVGLTGPRRFTFGPRVRQALESALAISAFTNAIARLMADQGLSQSTSPVDSTSLVLVFRSSYSTSRARLCARWCTSRTPWAAMWCRVWLRLNDLRCSPPPLPSTSPSCISRCTSRFCNPASGTMSRSRRDSPAASRSPASSTRARSSKNAQMTGNACSYTTP